MGQVSQAYFWRKFSAYYLRKSMSIADPIWPDRSLRNNPFLKDYFAEQDRINKPQTSIYYPNSDSSSSSSSNSPRIEHNSPHLRESNPFIHSIRDSHQERSQEREQRSFIHHEKPQDNDLGARIIQIAMDPFEDTWEIDRVARVLILANEFKKDEEGRIAQKEQNEQIDQKTSDIKQKLLDYVADPMGDFGSLDPGRLNRIEAIAKIIVQENPLIQNEKGNSEAPSKQTKFDPREDIQSEPDIKDKIQNHNQQRGLIKKGIQKVEHFIENHVPKVNPLQFTGKVSQQILHVQNKIQEQKVQNFENIIRGINDYVIWQCNGLLSCIPGLNHSSNEFYDHHKMGKKGEGLENSFYYWMGAATGITSEMFLLKGSPTAANIGRVAMQKAGNALVKAGVQCAIHSKLVTGSIGEGILPYLPHELGGTSVIAKESRGVLNGFSEAALFRAAETTSKIIKDIPQILEKVPELARFVQQPIKDGTDFFRGLFAFTKTPLDSHVFKNLTNQASVLPEIDSIANQAIAEIARDTAAAKEIFSDFSRVLDTLDDPLRGFQEYAEFVHRHEMRQFARDLGCSEEALPYVMKKVPKRADCSADTIDKTVSNILIAQDNIAYCDKYVRDPWIRDKLLQLLMPLQKHHAFSNKCIQKDWTRDYKIFLDAYGLDINKHWNLLLIPHLPQAHDDRYHRWCFNILTAAHNKVQSVKGLTLDQQKDLLLKIIEEKLTIPLRENPLLPMKKWYKFWENDKLQADSMTSSSTKDEDIIMPQ